MSSPVQKNLSSRKKYHSRKKNQNNKYPRLSLALSALKDRGNISANAWEEKGKKFKLPADLTRIFFSSSSSSFLSENRMESVRPEPGRKSPLEP